jgi:hypothetical protein
MLEVIHPPEVHFHVQIRAGDLVAGLGVPTHYRMLAARSSTRSFWPEKLRPRP